MSRPDRDVVSCGVTVGANSVAPVPPASLPVSISGVDHRFRPFLVVESRSGR